VTPTVQAVQEMVDVQPAETGELEVESARPLRPVTDTEWRSMGGLRDSIHARYIDGVNSNRELNWNIARRCFLAQQDDIKGTIKRIEWQVAMQESRVEWMEERKTYDNHLICPSPKPFWVTNGLFDCHTAKLETYNAAADASLMANLGRNIDQNVEWLAGFEKRLARANAELARSRRDLVKAKANLAVAVKEMNDYPLPEYSNIPSVPA
jgi:hypothetical protein